MPQPGAATTTVLSCCLLPLHQAASTPPPKEQRCGCGVLLVCWCSSPALQHSHTQQAGTAEEQVQEES
ncbi:hypothetical protein SEVIR_3G294051v4 [Setaria viridis]